MDISAFIKDGLFVLIPALYFFGVMLKASPMPDWLIPFALGAAGVLLSFVWHAEFGPRSIFDSVTQGLLCAAGAVYIKNLALQFQKRGEADDDKN